MQPRKNGNQTKHPWKLPGCLLCGQACPEETRLSVLHKAGSGSWPSMRTPPLVFGTRCSFRSGSSRFCVQWSDLDTPSPYSTSSLSCTSWEGFLLRAPSGETQSCISICLLQESICYFAMFCKETWHLVFINGLLGV